MYTRSIYNETPQQLRWEKHSVVLHRMPQCGLGIAVSGGSENSQNDVGETCVSDVLSPGPAEGKLQVDDRLLSVNGISLRNVGHRQTLDILQNCGNIVRLEVGRKVLGDSTYGTLPKTDSTLGSNNNSVYRSGPLSKGDHPNSFLPLGPSNAGLSEYSPVQSLKRTGLSAVNRTAALPALQPTVYASVPRLSEGDDLISLTLHCTKKNAHSVSLGTRFYVKEVTMDAWLKAGLRPGDVIVKINEQPVLTNSLHEVQRLLGRSKGDVRLVVQRSKSISNRNGFVGSLGHLSGMENGFGPGNRDIHGSCISPGNGAVSMNGKDGVRSQGYPNRNRLMPGPAPRFVAFRKNGSTIGFEMAGGNATGLFVARVLPNSFPDLHGVVEGDKVLKMNDKDTSDMTREECVRILSTMEEHIDIILQYQPEEFYRLFHGRSFAGDSFFVKAHFDCKDPPNGEMPISRGDILHVTDTLPEPLSINPISELAHMAGATQELPALQDMQWVAARVNKNKVDGEIGRIPNLLRAEKLSLLQRRGHGDKNGRKTNSLFRRKRDTRRAKSVTREHLADLSFESSVSFPVYERVILADATFIRPVVLFGALADVAREKLVLEFAEKFESPQTTSSSDASSPPGIVKLASIRDVIQKEKHCVLDVTVEAVEQLILAQYCPIIVFLHAKDKHTVRSERAKFSAAALGKSSRRLLEHSRRLQKSCSHLFTGIVDLEQLKWFPHLVDFIEDEQRKPTWVSRNKPTDLPSGDTLLFPMLHRMSYALASDPESDGEIGFSQSSNVYSHRPTPHARPRSYMESVPLMRSNSDPSIAHAKMRPFSAAVNQFSPPADFSPRQGPFMPASYLRENGPMSSPKNLQSPTDTSAFSKQQDSMRSDNRAIPGNYPYRNHHREGAGRFDHRGNDHFSDNKLSLQDAIIDSPSTYTHIAGHPANRHDDSKLQDKVMDKDKEIFRNYDDSRDGQGEYEDSRNAARHYAMDDARQQENYSDERERSSNYEERHGRQANYGLSPGRSVHVDRQYNAHSVYAPLSGERRPFKMGPGVRAFSNATYMDHNELLDSAYDRRMLAVGKERTTGMMVDDYSHANGPNSTPSVQRPPANSTDQRRLPPPVAPKPVLNSVPRRAEQSSTYASLATLQAGVRQQSHANDSAHPQIGSNGPPYGGDSRQSYGEDNRRAYSSENVHHFGNVDRQPNSIGSDNRTSEPSHATDDSQQVRRVLATVSAVVDSDGGILESPETGVSLRVPPGAIPQGVRQRIYFKVCDKEAVQGNFDGDTFLSPLVMCEPQGLKFDVPLELRLPHRLNFDSGADWSQSKENRDKNTVSVMVHHF